VKPMSGKKRIEEDYKRFGDEIEQMVKEELRKIREKTSQTRTEAEEVGESVEQTFSKDDKAINGKKS
jgi:hypothetical protein